MRSRPDLDRKRKGWRQAGLCVSCGAARDSRWLNCAKCRALAVARTAGRAHIRRFWLACNRCVRCGQADPAWVAGIRKYRHCLQCRRKTSAAMRRRRQEQG